MTSFLSNALGGNPFSTPVGARIEQATDGTLASENWALNMEICDIINESEDGPKDAIKAIRKRLTTNAGKNYTIVMYTLIVLETCVKNCGKRLHVLVCTKDFIQELVKLIGPKNDPPTAVQEKVLSLIQSWADAFKNQPELSGVGAVYQDLVSKGIEFPATDLDAMAPIHTPRKTIAETAPPVGVEPQVLSSVLSQPTDLPSPAGLTPDQRAKLQSELDVVQSNMSVFGEMLSEMKPGQEQPDEIELLQELNGTCQTMQKRLVDLISKLASDELCADLLRINDDMNNLFLRYSRWEKKRDPTGQSASSVLAKATLPPSAKSAATRPPMEQSDSLIDFDEDLPAQLSKLSAGGAAGGAAAQLSKIDGVTARNAQDDFDMFAQSRNVTYESSKKATSSYQDNLNPDQVSGGLRSVAQAKQEKPEDLEFHEMANWLGETGTEESVTSSEFDRFLAERAAAAEVLPSSTGSTNQNNPRTSNKDDKKGSLLAS